MHQWSFTTKYKYAELFDKSFAISSSKYLVRLWNGMKQFFITKHLITKHLITKHLITKHLITKHLITTSTNWVTDISPNSSPNSSSHFSSDLYSPQYFHNNFIRISSSHLHRIIFEKHLCYYIFNTTSFTNSLSQSLSDRFFDKHFTNIQMSYIFHHKHSQTLYHEF